MTAEREGVDCNTCANLGKIDGLTQETHCEHCKWQGWRADHYVPNAELRRAATNFKQHAMPPRRRLECRVMRLE